MQVSVLCSTPSDSSAVPPVRADRCRRQSLQLSTDTSCPTRDSPPCSQYAPDPFGHKLQEVNDEVCKGTSRPGRTSPGQLNYASHVTLTKVLCPPLAATSCRFPWSDSEPLLRRHASASCSSRTPRSRRLRRRHRKTSTAVMAASATTPPAETPDD